MFLSSNHAPLNARQARWMVFLLRACAVADILAVIVAVMPAKWIASLHAQLSMGHFPVETIAIYLVRSASLMYAAYGLLLFFVSFDVNRYLPLIHFLALIAIVHGLFLIGIDFCTAMPWWWTAGEGPLLITWGIVVVNLRRMNS